MKKLAAYTIHHTPYTIPHADAVALIASGKAELARPDEYDWSCTSPRRHWYDHDSIRRAMKSRPWGFGWAAHVPFGPCHPNRQLAFELANGADWITAAKETISLVEGVPLWDIPEARELLIEARRAELWRARPRPECRFPSGYRWNPDDQLPTE